MLRRLGRLMKGAAGGREPAPEAAPRPSEIALGGYVHYIGKMPATEAGGACRVLPLYSEAQLESAVRELRGILAADDGPACRAALATPFAASIRRFAGSWFQRIDYPEHGIASTSDHSLAYIDEGSFNTLGRRLASREACILRPAPKWRYIRPLLPDVAGKSVLEIGASNGFFSFRFAELGAERVTGIEIVRSHHECAVWSAEVLGHRNVTFLNTDFLLDLALEAHDVVFLSEVHNHFLFPLYGLLRLVNLARETVILDTVTDVAPGHGTTLSSGWHTESGRMIYHSFHLTHALLVDFLDLVGVAPGRVTRYLAPDEPHHSLYVIDTRALEETRARRGCSEYLRAALELRFRR